MKPPDDDFPAFPRPAVFIPESDDFEDYLDMGAAGMSLRDWFAGQFLAGHIAGRIESFDTDPATDPAKVAARAFRYADAMLAARERKGGGT